MLPLHEVASAAAGGLSHAPKQTLATAADTALKLADGAAALGAERFGRRTLPEGESWMLGDGSRTARQSAADANPKLGVERSGAEPVAGDVTDAVDADVAEPVTSAMSGAPGNALGWPTAGVPVSATDGAPRSARGVGQTGGDVAGSATDPPATDPPVEQFPTTRTVDTHILRLRQKFENDPERPSHILTVHGQGYRFAG